MSRLLSNIILLKLDVYLSEGPHIFMGSFADLNFINDNNLEPVYKGAYCKMMSIMYRPRELVEFSSPEHEYVSQLRHLKETLPTMTDLTQFNGKKLSSFHVVCFAKNPNLNKGFLLANKEELAKQSYIVSKHFPKHIIEETINDFPWDIEGLSVNPDIDAPFIGRFSDPTKYKWCISALLARLPINEIENYASFILNELDPQQTFQFLTSNATMNDYYFLKYYSEPYVHKGMTENHVCWDEGNLGKVLSEDFAERYGIFN